MYLTRITPQLSDPVWDLPDQNYSTVILAWDLPDQNYSTVIPAWDLPDQNYSTVTPVCGGA